MWYKRSTYLINPKFQLKLSLFVSSLVLLISLVYPFTIYELFRNLALQNSSPTAIQTFTNNKMQLILVLCLYQLCFILVVFVICVFQAHKIAGPMFKLQRYLNQIAEGGSIQKISFRSGDHFTEIAEAINNALEHLKNNQIKDFSYLSEVSAYIRNLSLVVPDDKKAVLNEILVKLDEIQDRFKPI
ncbi:MAG: methyl-accepting chemotaxis protein [Oligoflexia bacterium]|nr:methyl-accepting chemotaxis protein [Oligoflexia bacterium]